MNLLNDLWRRQAELLDGRQFEAKYQVTARSIERLGLETTLKGHNGCVNCLQWSSDGNFLLSGSDDLKVILWDPFRSKPQSTTIRTEHRGNIFSVKFLPHTDNRVVASGAADYQIQVHDVIKQKTVATFANHMKRVKRLDVAPDCPNLIWSASEDGTVMETDIRANPSQMSVLVNLMSIVGRGAEAKCVSINQKRPELMAVGASDPYVRVFDRRQLKARLIEFPAETQNVYEKRAFLAQEERGVSAPLADCCRYYIPGHLHRTEEMKRKKGGLRLLACTYATFSPNGRELLVNLGGEQVYLYDLSDPNPKLIDTKPFEAFLQRSQSENGFKNEAAPTPLPPAIEDLKQKANAAFGQERFSKAIALYNRALMSCPHPILFANRAAAYIKRKWDGDVYTALRDCYRAVSMDPNHLKAHLRLCRCLLELGWIDQASTAIEAFQRQFPEHSQVSACQTLIKDVYDARSEDKEDDEHGADGEISSDSEDDILSSEPRSDPKPNSKESRCRSLAADYQLRFCGHCNTTTDIKEANFFGNNGQCVVAGSDDGKFYCWDRSSNNIVKVLEGDESIVNCLQPHPSSCLLASSGIDPVVRLWAPLAEDGETNTREVSDFDTVTASNQRRMRVDPFESMLFDIGYRIRRNEDEDSDGEGPSSEVQCRTS